MLHNAKDLTGYTIRGTDGDIGQVRQFYFDEDTWTVRYLVTRTGRWLSERQLLISPIAISSLDVRRQCVSVDLKRERVAGMPALNINRPVPRRYEARYHSYFGWPAYWGGSQRWGDDRYPGSMFTAEPINEPVARLEDLRRDTLLRSSAEVAGFSVVAGDEILGTVEDFIIDDVSWGISYCMLAAGSPASGRKLLVSPQWIDEISVSERMIVTDLPLEAAKSSPPFDPARGVTRDYEVILFQHYGRGREIDAVRKPRGAVEV